MSDKLPTDYDSDEFSPEYSENTSVMISSDLPSREEKTEINDTPFDEGDELLSMSSSLKNMRNGEISSEYLKEIHREIDSRLAMWESELNELESEFAELSLPSN